MSHSTSKFVRAGIVLLGLFLGLIAPSAPVALGQASSGITSPTPGSSVSGSVPIMGTAVIDTFQRYELYFKQEPSGDDSYVYFDGQTQQVVNGQLGTWETGGLAPGIYTVRLRVVKADGNYAEFFVPNISVNQGPASTPTPDQPTPTPIPTATFTPVPQPTPVIAAVEQPDLGETATPEPTSEAEAVAVAPSEPEAGGQPAAESVAPESTGNSVTRAISETFGLDNLRDQFFRGVRYSAAAFLIVAAIFIGRKLLEWALTQYR